MDMKKSKLTVLTLKQGKHFTVQTGGKSYTRLSYADAENLIKEIVGKMLQNVLKPSMIIDHKQGAEILFAVFPSDDVTDK